MKASENISDHIALIADPDSFELTCEGDTDSASLKLDKSQLVSINVTEHVCSLFPLDYFLNLIKAVPSDMNVKIELDNDYPVKLLFDLADGNGTVEYLLAPRIESE
jgi:proliferating cell nuclear antigen